MLRLWALLAGAALFAPALALPGLALPLQPLDGLILLGWPLMLVHARRIPGGAVVVLGPGVASILMSFAVNGGQGLVLIWTLGFALPFVTLIALALSQPGPRAALLAGIIAGGWVSLILFAAQIVWGAEALDFRSNPAFRLPPQYGRAFALFPEVSTCALHLLILLGLGLTAALHPASPRAAQRHGRALAAAAALALMFTRSTSVIVLLPVLGLSALWITRRPSPRAMLLALGLGVVLALFLGLFLTAFYGDRLGNASAERSAAMRLASILGGLSVFSSGEVFGVGIGENALVRLRALDIARAWNLRFGSLPEGVNSQIIGRLFEEGWPAALHLGLAALALTGQARVARADPARAMLLMLALASLAGALLVVGYRGIYTNWIWLGVAAALWRGQKKQGLRPQMFRAKRFSPTIRSRLTQSQTPRP